MIQRKIKFTADYWKESKDFKGHRNLFMALPFGVYIIKTPNSLSVSVCFLVWGIRYTRWDDFKE